MGQQWLKWTNHKKMLKLDAKDCERGSAGAICSISITEKVTVNVFTKSLKPENINCLVHHDLSVGSTNHDYSVYKIWYLHLPILSKQKISQTNVKLKIDQDNFIVIRPIEQKSEQEKSMRSENTSRMGTKWSIGTKGSTWL